MEACTVLSDLLVCFCITLYCIHHLRVQIYVYSLGKTMKLAATYHRNSDTVSKDVYHCYVVIRFWLCCLMFVYFESDVGNNLREKSVDKLVC